MTANRAPTSPDTPDDLRAEYDFDYKKSRPNRFASRMRGSVVAVVLEPDEGRAAADDASAGESGGGT